MYLSRIDGGMLKRMFLSAAHQLNEHKEQIDALNVFPVPDGDTGTNMSLTALASAKEASAMDSNSVAEIAKAASMGALRGARGNSGVILSQLIRGFSKGLADCETATVKDLTEGFRQAVEMAYKAVMKPKEGTILTVAAALYEKADEMLVETDNIEEFGRSVIAYGNEVLQKTREMLPILKEAGVVDAGGFGLICIIEGAFQSLFQDTPVTILHGRQDEKAPVEQPLLNVDIPYSYCTEFLISVKDHSAAYEAELKEHYDNLGDSIVVIADEDIIKVHIHTDHPGLVIEKALSYGSLSSLKIDNMKEQHRHQLVGPASNEDQNRADWKEIGFVSISMGNGISEIFRSLGVDAIIEGGQTMNPSTEDILSAVSKVPARNVIVLPNNKNIILAAQQAQEMSQNQQVFAVPTNSIPQGISAMMAYQDGADVHENAQAMEKAAQEVKTGQVTYAVRDTVFEGKQIREGDLLGIIESNICEVSDSVEQCALQTIQQMVEDDTEIISLFYGAEVMEDESRKLLETLQKSYENCEISMYAGNQPLYYYIISVE